MVVNKLWFLMNYEQCFFWKLDLFVYLNILHPCSDKHMSESKHWSCQCQWQWSRVRNVKYFTHYKRACDTSDIFIWIDELDYSWNFQTWRSLSGVKQNNILSSKCDNNLILFMYSVISEYYLKALKFNIRYDMTYVCHSQIV